MIESLKKLSLKEKLISDYSQNKIALFGKKSVRESAFESFTKLGFPTKKNEEYKYSNTESLGKENYETKTVGKDKSLKLVLPIFHTSELTVVFIDGKFSAKNSTILDNNAGIVVKEMSTAFISNKSECDEHFAKYIDSESDAFSALNNALAEEGTFIQVTNSAVENTIVHIVNVATGNSFSQTRHLILLNKNSKLSIVETFLNETTNDKCFMNSACEIVVLENANLDHYIVQNINDSTTLVKTTHLVQHKNSVANTSTYTLNGGFVRNNLTLQLEGEHIESNLNGLYLPNGKQHVDNHTLVDHRKPHCNSNELYKGVAMDAATAVFNGKIYVRKDAQKTNAFQSNKNILMSDDATVNTKPQLEIYADDVKCSHGTSTGEIDEAALFYLQARGISKENAKKLMLRAFAEEVTGRIYIAALREYVEKCIHTKIA